MSTVRYESLRRFLFPLYLAVLGAPLAAPAFAATVVVNTVVDQATGSCAGTCSLRDAVATAQADDTIKVPAGHYVLTLGVIQSRGKNLTIVGAGARATVIDGNSSDRIFIIDALDSVELDDLALVNGASPDISGGGCIGGSANLLTLRRSSISNCTAPAGAGLAWFGPVTIDQCTFKNNRAQFFAAVAQTYQSATITNSTFSGNISTDYRGIVGTARGNLAIESGSLTNVTIVGNQGGGILMSGPITMTNSIMAANPGGDCIPYFPGILTVIGTASLDGDNSCGLAGPGNLPGVDPRLGPLADHGGPTDTHAPLAGSPVVDRADSAACPAVDQRGAARPQGAGCDIGAYEQDTPPPPPATVVVNTTVDQATGSCAGLCSLRDAVATAQPRDRIQVPAGHFVLTLGKIASNKSLTIQGAGARETVLDGNSQNRIFEFSPLGGIEIRDLTLTHGSAPDGGGGCIRGSGVLLSLARCSVSNCSGGAVAWIGPLRIDSSTFQGNQAKGGLLGPAAFSVVFQTAGAATIVDSTFSGNDAAGGTITIEAGTLTNTTVTANRGGLLILGPIALKNTIVAKNQGFDCGFGAGGASPFFSSDHSLDSDLSCNLQGPGDRSGVDPRLGPLADHGGPTDTHAPLPGSPVLDAGNNATCPQADQRGAPRPQGGACDIGAYEQTNLTLAADRTSVAVDEGQTASNSGTVSEGRIVTLTASLGTVVNHGDGTWSWSFATSDGPSQSQTVTVTGDDGFGGLRSTSFSLVVHNVPPAIAGIADNGPVFTGHPVTLTVTATDPAGANDPLTYSFDCNDDGIFEIGPQAGNSASCTFSTAGSHTVPVRVADDDGGVTLGSTTATVLNPPPDCSHATASPHLLWPPSHKLVPIQISGIVNPAGGPMTIAVTRIFQDEPVLSPDSGDTSPDASGLGTAVPSVRAERDSAGNGRVYHITFTATAIGGVCTGTLTVGVPLDQSANGGPIDEGALYDSTQP
jgi:CSLREA domain-containing protein